MSRSYFSVLIPLLVLVVPVISYAVDPWLVRNWLPWLLLPCGIALVFGVQKWRQQIQMRRFRTGPRRLVLAMLASMVALGVAIGANYLVYQHAEAEGKAYPLTAGPLLEQYRTEHGSYPPTLIDVAGAPAPPQLIRQTYFYSTDGKSYSFRFPVPGQLTEHWVYRSASKAWSRDNSPGPAVAVAPASEEE